MTITVSLNVPAGKAARVTRSDGTSQTFPAGTNINAGVVYDGVTVTIEEIEAEEPAAEASAQGGGTGNGPPG